MCLQTRVLASLSPPAYGAGSRASTCPRTQGLASLSPFPYVVDFCAATCPQTHESASLSPYPYKAGSHTATCPQTHGSTSLSLSLYRVGSRVAMCTRTHGPASLSLSPTGWAPMLPRVPGAVSWLLYLPPPQSGFLCRHVSPDPWGAFSISASLRGSLLCHHESPRLMANLCVAHALTARALA
jgi:hypothetical protein